jgi:UDP-glucose 4-epimerase
MNILITGGLGYIGSHTAAQLAQEGHEVVLVDSCMNADEAVLKSLEKITGKELAYYKTDVCNLEELRHAFMKHPLDAVIHFAALKSVGESVSKPLDYYRNNVDGLLNVLSCVAEFGVERFVFSSSATVYGDASIVPTPETADAMRAINPYGWTKVMGERIVTDFLLVHPEKKMTILRYFNPVGAHASYEIGESITGSATNLMPLILRATNPDTPLTVFGVTHATIDGTCIRDYIHVMDLAEAHGAALHGEMTGVTTYNVGTGVGYSVLDMLKTFEETNGVKVHYSVGEKRPGDTEVSLGDVEKIRGELGFKTKRDLKQMCADAWGRYQKASQK